MNETKNDEAVEFIGVLRDEMARAGMPSGDRIVLLANVRELLAIRDNSGWTMRSTARDKNESIAMRFNGTPMLVERVGCSACGEGVKEVHVTLGSDARTFDGEWADFFWDIATDTRVRSRLSRESTA